MELSSLASIFGRHEFLIRRLHSLTGLAPVGAYMVVHLFANGSIIDGPDRFQGVVDQIHAIYPSALLFLEWTFIFLPILFHGVIGMLIVTRGKRNVRQYGFAENIRYTLQRATGVVAFVFILYHVFHMHGWLRWEWWHQSVAMRFGGAQFDPHDALTAAAALQASPVVLAFYAVGVLACVYHLANGLWTMGITWGAWTSPRAQRWANIPCAAFGVILAVFSMTTLYAMATVDVAAPVAEADLSTVPGALAPAAAAPEMIGD